MAINIKVKCIIIIMSIALIDHALRAEPAHTVTMSGFSLGVCDGRDFCRSSIRDSTIGINFDALGEVEHFEHVSGDLLDLLKSGDHADVTFLVDGVKLQAHRVVLAARCSYFKVLLFGHMREAHTGAEIPISDATPESFKALLEYVYSGRVCLGDLSEQVNVIPRNVKCIVSSAILSKV